MPSGRGIKPHRGDPGQLDRTYGMPSDRQGSSLMERKGGLEIKGRHRLNAGASAWPRSCTAWAMARSFRTWARAKIELHRRRKISHLLRGGGHGPGERQHLSSDGRRLVEPGGLAGLELVLPDTGRTLPSGSASASRTTYTFGNALIGCGRGLEKKYLAPGRFDVEARKTG